MPVPLTLIPRPYTEQAGSITHLRKRLRRTIYKLKWTYGCPIDVYHTTRGEYDTRTGKRSYFHDKISITRAIVLPGAQHRSYFYSITHIQANSKFITGGDIQLDDREIIIDGKDLPPGYAFVMNDYIIWDHKRYDIIKLNNLEYGTGWHMVLRNIENMKTNEIHDETLKDLQTPQSEVE